MTKESFCWNSFMWLSVLYKRRSFFKERNLPFRVGVGMCIELYLFLFEWKLSYLQHHINAFFSLRIFCSWCYLNNTCVGRLILYTNYRLQMKRPNAEVVKIQILFICTSFTITIIVLRKTLKSLPPPVCKRFYAS